ncbi:hypothetical protein DYU11_01590 [Fibrisoma montanum]|uniref:BT4734-like N-terminal domain-containing protein n=1 Tax=Fibrisoma montanum TaxID=2305895 RepID=A0A418MHZ1_9BACT|nr:BT4734/BF3469 family protein [Fibrisoma montanum]RIV27036.1 hypothetical protein DYU11_01590 [Fibrisoma montanum]
MQPKISIFKDALTNTPLEVRADVATLVSRVRSEKYRPQTEHLRSLPTDAAKKYKKTGFIAVTWSGTFVPTRSKANLQAHSGLICIDIDKISPDRFDRLRGQLQADAFTHVLFISPSGNGLKCVVKIDYQQPADHEAFFRQIGDYYRDCYDVTATELDASGKNVDRLCFLPHDPQCFYNPDSDVMPLADEYTISETHPAPAVVQQSDGSIAACSTPPAPPTTTTTNYRKLARCADLIRNAPDGTKHHALCKAATLAGGFIASGLVSEADAIRVLEDEVRAKPNVADFEAARRTIRTQIEFGKTKPIEDEGMTRSRAQGINAEY